MNFIGLNIEEKINQVCKEYSTLMELLSNMEMTEEDIDFFNHDFPKLFSQILMQRSQYNFYVPDRTVVLSLNEEYYNQLFVKINDLFASLLEFSMVPEEELLFLKFLYRTRLIILSYVPESYFTLESMAKRHITENDMKVYQFEEDHKFDIWWSNND